MPKYRSAKRREKSFSRFIFSVRSLFDEIIDTVFSISDIVKQFKDEFENIHPQTKLGELRRRKRIYYDRSKNRYKFDKPWETVQLLRIIHINAASRIN